jgi:hypothetical protein
MRARAVVAAALLLALTGCGGQPERQVDVLVPPVPASTTVAEPTATSSPNVTVLQPLRTTPAPGAEWLHWRPTYQAVRRATGQELALLGNRVTARNASEWTATDSLRGVEVAFTPTHVRVRVPQAALYFRLRPGGPRHLYVACTERTCVESGRDAVAWGPESTNAYLERMAGYVRDLVAEQTRPGVFRSQGPAWLATVRSPDGPLSCVVLADELLPVSRLQGRPVGTAGVRTRCVDTHGLVVPLDLGLPPGGWSVVDGVSGPVRVPKRDVSVY